MLNLDRALGNDRLLRALTGLNRKAFDALCEVFSAVYQETLESDPKPRQRARGGGRKARLRSMESKLFFILFYFKCYPTFDVLSFLFDLERDEPIGGCIVYKRFWKQRWAKRWCCPNENWKVWSSFSNGFQR